MKIRRELGVIVKQDICCDRVGFDYHATLYLPVQSHTIFVTERRVCNACFDKWGDRYEEWVDTLEEAL